MDDDLDEQLTRREWIVEYWDGRRWMLSGHCRRESGNPIVKSLDDCVTIVKEAAARWEKNPETTVPIDRYRLRHAKNKKDVIPACVLLA